MTIDPLDVEFNVQDPGTEFRGDVPTKVAFEKNYSSYYETFVREVLQNSNDASLDNDDPVRVTFSFDILSDERLREFQRFINWDRLKEHYETVVGDDHSLRLEEYLTHLDDTGEILTLTVHDENTSGLRGAEDARSGETPYTSLVRDWQVTYKEDSSAGGSHGVGKSMLWASSGISTVVFNSVPAEPRSDVDPPRLVGRSILPDHYIDDDHHGGKGWIGRVDEESGVGHPTSVWGEEATDLADKLNVSRRVDEPGTSILIPGFCSPTGNIRPPVDDVIKAFVRAAARNFWPAIYRDELEVVVERPDGGRSIKIKSDTIDQVPEVKPFIACYEGRTDSEAEIQEPGDVGVTTIPVEFERKNGGGEVNGEVTLCARLKDPGDDQLSSDESEYDLTNHTAIFRGSGMVVDYVSKSEPAVYGDNYYGVLIAGEARLWGETAGVDPDPETERAVDEFLTAAEPASHDSWDSTAMLTKKYKRGCVSEARSLQGGRLNSNLVELVQQETSHEGRFVSAVARHLPDFDHTATDFAGSEEDDDVDDDNDTSAGLSSDWSWDFDGDRWKFHGWVEPTDDPDDPWGVEFSIPKKGEDNVTVGHESVDRISSPTSEVSTRVVETEKKNRTVRVGIVTTEESIDGFEFECQSVPLESLDPFSGHGGETTLSLTRADPGGDD